MNLLEKTLDYMESEDYKEYKNLYNKSLDINDVIKNSIQSYGVYRALAVWGEYFINMYENVLEEDCIKKIKDAFNKLMP